MMSTDDGLFPEPERRNPPGPAARRTRKQRMLISFGVHPLSMPMRKTLFIRREGQTCGGCRWLEPLDRDVPVSQTVYKCWFGGGSRVTRGGATTVRKWWPACINFEGESHAQDSGRSQGEAAGRG